jgi:hypothetical protein
MAWCKVKAFFEKGAGMTSPPTAQEKGSTFAGVIVGFGALTGFMGLAAALWSLLSGHLEAAGLCLGAASLAFGLLANALLRH